MNRKSEKQEEDINQSIYLNYSCICKLNTFDTYDVFFKETYSFIWCYMCYVNQDYLLKLVIVTNITY